MFPCAIDQRDLTPMGPIPVAVRLFPGSDRSAQPLPDAARVPFSSVDLDRHSGGVGSLSGRRRRFPPSRLAGPIDTSRVR